MSVTCAAPTPALPLPSRRQRIKSALTPVEWRRAGYLTAAVVGLHVLGWGVLLLAVVPQHFEVGNSVYGIGLGVTAYTLGMRHAFDADHIAAIDNTTRKFMAEGKRPMSVGFWFSLGHSSVVFGLTLLLAFGLKISGAVQDGSSGLHKFTTFIGPLVSGVFLYLIAAFNLAVMIGIMRVSREMKRGKFDEHQLEKHLDERGLMNRFLGRFVGRIREPWHMYPLGFLFGLGFDTATEIGLLLVAGGAIAGGLPWYAILCLPVLFAAGMSLFDTIDGSFMNFAYGWAFSHPVRKVYYNLVITGLSIAVAFLIGSVELLQIAQDKLTLGGGFWAWVSGLDLNIVGYVIVAMFVLVWVIALVFYRLGNVEERWSARLAPVQE
ncbi:MAG: nickel/cobalt transporter (NiCoT) family protein [Frankiales bacterium]|nr:nickel/cobalt transporter (NiCoT) family protein [Frankiales bacterium]